MGIMADGPSAALVCAGDILRAGGSLVLHHTTLFLCTATVTLDIAI